MDLVSVAVLSLFASAAVGGAVGFVVARISRFEVGLSAGLLIFGAVAIFFSARCLLEYRAFAYAGANALWGEVIAIEDKSVNESGTVTTPVPIVRFTAPDNVIHTVAGPSAGSAKVGEHVNVIYDPIHPERSRVAQIAELRGGAIAMLLFGTFPTTFALWMLFAYTRGPDEPSVRRGNARRNEGVLAKAKRSAPSTRAIATTLNVGLVCSILWIGMARADLHQAFVEGFGAIATLLLAYALWGATRGGAEPAWSLGLLVLAINFAVWAVALQILR